MQFTLLGYRPRFPGAVPGSRRGRVVAVLGLTLLCGVWTTQLLRARVDAEGAPSGRLLQELGSELDGIPTLLPRLSIASAYRPCPTADSEDRCAAGFAPAPPRGVASIAARAARGVRLGNDPDALHAAGVIDAVFDASGKSTERAIYSLRNAARTTGRPAPVLADLAAVYLVRAERTGGRRDLLVAVDVAHQALRLEPRHLGARYNLALALHRFGLVEEAAAEWRAYLTGDSSSGWANEARRRLAEASPASLPSPPAADAPPAAFSAYAAVDPYQARLDGWNRLLGKWGEAVLAGSHSADGWLDRTEATARALEHRPGGDATLADAVRTIRATRNTAALRRLALAHREYAAGAIASEVADYGAAAERLRVADDVAGGAPVPREWTRLFLAVTRMWAGDGAGAEALLRSVVAAADTVRHPALSGRARIALSALLFRADRFEESMGQSATAARLLARAGERELLGGALLSQADAQLMLHDADAGYATLHRALEVLRPYRGVPRLHAALVSAAESAADDGLLYAALHAANEDVRVARRIGGAALPEASLRRARFLAAAGEPAQAGREVDTARAALLRVGDANVRRRMEADAAVTEAFIRLAADPADAAAQLDSAARVYDAQETPFLAYAALVGAAQARLASGDLAAATARLRTAFGILERRRDATRMEPRRAAIFDAARGVVDRVVMLELAAGREVEALRYLDRGRATLDVAARGRPEGADRVLESPPGEVVVEYALIADTLLAWAVTGRQVRLFRARVDTARLVGSVSRLRMLLEGEGDAAAVDALLAELYDRLVRPLEAALGRPGTPLVVIADGDLAAVPFAALRDSRRGRYLVQDRPLRWAVSLREAGRGGGARAGPAVFVADPAFHSADHPGLQRLPGAAAEARTVAAGYPRRRLLAGADATPAALRSAVAGAGLVHYAGHAVFDDERPERSYLVLAPVPGRPESGRMTAEELAGLELRGAPLVVLAACQSVNAGRGRAGGFSGLAGALLAAGANGVVGGLWEVEDARTRTLMTGLHGALRDGADGAGALRQAQLRMLASTDASLRSPAAWAGFRYVGR
jgi:CHAT domain-containing protein/tetratricopeptide (TPR) repeat protein